MVEMCRWHEPLSPDLGNASVGSFVFLAPSYVEVFFYEENQRSRLYVNVYCIVYRIRTDDG